MKTNFKKQALSLVLSLAMVVGVGVTTFASDPKPGVHQPAVEKPKELKIKKVLTLPAEGVKTPQQTFTFTFAAQSFNSDISKTNECPKITAVTVNYTNNDGKDETNKKYDDDATTNGKQVIKVTDDILKNVTFTKDGQYTYTVKETEVATNGNKIWNSSKAEYLVSLFVQKKGDKFEVYDIQIQKNKNDDGTAPTEKKKTPYAPGIEGESSTGKWKDNNFVFNNAYEEKAGNSNPSGKTPTDDDKKGFVLDKKVDGDTDNKITTEFEFKLTVTKDLASKQTDKFKYKVVDKEGTAGNEKEGEYGATGNIIKLKAGERVVLSNVLLGSKVEVEETVKNGYTPTVTGKITKEKDGFVLTDEGGNAVTFTNKKDTAVGFILNNLPFIVLVAFAGFGILFFVKNKKDKDEEEQRA